MIVCGTIRQTEVAGTNPECTETPLAWKTKCPGELPVKKTRKPKFWVGLGKLELEPVFEVTLGELELEPILEVSLGELELWDEEVKAWVNAKGDYRFEDGFKVGLGELELEDVKTNGLQTVINNGLEASGTVKKFIKGLFD